MILVEKIRKAIVNLILSIVCFATTGACHSNLFMLLDVNACLQGLREAYNDSPRGSSRSPSPFEDGDEKGHSPRNDGNDRPLESMSEIEAHLLQLLERDKLLDETEAAEKARRCSQIARLKPFALAHLPHAFPCKDTYNVLPSHPSRWPQCPVMIRPTPYTSTKIRGIRRASKLEYEYFPGFCAGCVLPVNNGCEKRGDAIVIDFESSHFVGTLLLRIKNTPKSDLATYQDESYFDGKKRKFQALIRGRFKTPLKMSECVTGQAFDRPAGKLPARWIVTSFIKFVTTLAPQLEARVDGDEPRFLTPLVATAHTVLARESKEGDAPIDLEEPVEEPPATDGESLVNESVLGSGISVKSSSSPAGRMKVRKKIYNEISAKKADAPCFSTAKEYTFEFYQHMLDFGEELAIDMGRPIGKVGLAQATDGQPIKIMSAHRNQETNELDSLWSFDVWHESLFPYAEMAHGDENGK